MSSNEALNRRAFLTSTGALLVTLAAPSDWAAAAINGAAARPPVTGDQLDSYITIDRDGTVVAYYGKIDGGQGLGTAMMVAFIFGLCFLWPLIGTVPSPTGGTILDANLPAFSPGHFLGTQETGDGILVLLAVTRIHHAFEEAVRTQARVVPGGTRQRADDGGGQYDFG